MNTSDLYYLRHQPDNKKKIDRENNKSDEFHFKKNLNIFFMLFTAINFLENN